MRNCPGLVLLFLTLLLAGCGNSASSLNQPLGAPPGPQGEVIFGRLFPGLEVAGADIVVEDLQGAVLARGVSDESGSFQISHSNFPEQVRVKADLAGFEPPMQSVVDFDRQSATYVLINLPSTLVSLYLQAHPEEDLAEVKRKLARLFGVSESTDLTFLRERSPFAPFSHLAFLSDAASNGGFAILVEQTLSNLESGVQGDPEAYRVSATDLSADLSTLEPTLVELARKVQADAADGIGSIVGGFIKGVGEGIVEDLAVEGLTWLAEALGLNFGPSLSEIQEELGQILDALHELSSQMDQTAYQQAVGDINNHAIIPIEALQELLSDQVQVANLTDQPFTPSSGVTDLLDKLGQFQAVTALLTIQNYMLGADGQINIQDMALKIKLVDELAVDQPPRFMGMPIRNNDLLQEVLQPFHLYEGYQALACHYLAEAAHVSPNPIQDMLAGYEEIAKAAASIKTQRQLRPQPLPSDDVMVDLEHGLMWYREVQPATDYRSAQRFAAALKVTGDNGVVYEDWRLPNFQEALTLQTRGRLSHGDDPSVPVNSRTGYGDYGKATAGLPSLGFEQAGRLTKDGSLHCTDYVGVSLPDPLNPFGQPPALGPWIANINHEHDNGGPTLLGLGISPFVVVRSIDQSLLKYTSTVPYNNLPQYPPASPLQIGELPGLGVPTSLVLNRSGNQLTPIVRYNVFTGGDFTCGQSPKTVNVSLPSQNATVSDGAGGQTYGKLPAYQSDSPALLEAKNLPGTEGELVWHSDLTTPQQVTVSGTMRGFNGSTFPSILTASLAINEVPQARHPKKIRILPRNRLYLNATTQERYTVVGFYDDHSVRDLTSTAQLEVVSTSTGLAVTGASFSSTVAGVLLLSNPAEGNLTIKATVPSSPDFTDSAKLSVALP